MLQSRHAHVGVQRRVRCRRLVAIAEIKKLHLIIKCKVICYNEHLESPWTRRKNVEFDGHRNLLEAALGRTVSGIMKSSRRGAGASSVVIDFPTEYHVQVLR